MSNYTAKQISDAIASMQAQGQTPTQIAAAAAAQGVSAAEIASAMNIPIDQVTAAYTAAGVDPNAGSSPAAPVAPTTPALGLLNNGVQNVGGVKYDNSPVGLGNDVNMGSNAPVAPKTADLSQYNNQTQAGIQRAGLGSIMNTVANNGNLADIVKSGLTPTPVGQYKDASGTMVTAPPNTFMVSHADGSGGALNYFFQVDPSTGTTTPIANAGQNLTYTPGSPGGVFNGLISAAGDIVKAVAPVALDAALIANGIDPTIAGAITGGASAAANGGNVVKGALTGGAAGYVGGAASNAVGANAPITSGLAGGAAAGATNAALNGQNVAKGALTGAVVGAGAGATGLGTMAQNATDLAQDTTEINNALQQFNATNPGASATQQADYLLNDPNASFSASQISNVLGANNPISQVASTMAQSAALNSQEVAAGAQTAAGPVAPGGTQPSWVQPLADAYTAAQQSGDWSQVSSIIQSNGLTADQIAETYGITNPSTLSNINDLVLNPVSVTGSATEGTTTTPGVVTSTNGQSLGKVNVTASKDPGLTAPATPAITPVTAVIPSVNVTAPKDPGLTAPATPPVTAVDPSTTSTSSTPSNPTPATPPVVPVVPNTPTVVTTTGTSTSPGPSTPTLANPGLVNPGLNPGWLVNGANQNFYNTSNPVQDTYYWGAHPYMMNQGDMGSYNNVAGAPATPWGLQNFQEPVSYSSTGQPIYGPASPAAARAATGPGTTAQQLTNAWNSGDYSAVNNLISQNNVTANQAQGIWGVTPSQASAVGVNFAAPATK